MEVVIINYYNKINMITVKLNSEMELVIPSGAPTRIKEILNT